MDETIYGTTQCDTRRVMPTVTRYSADEVIRQFIALYNCFDFRAGLAVMGIGRFDFIRRAKALNELKTLVVALWGLALQKSFPSDAQDFFDELRARIPEFVGRGRAAENFASRLDVYTRLLAPKKDADFLPVAEYMSELLFPKESDLRRIRLKLSLVIRNMYGQIFDQLI